MIPYSGDMEVILRSLDELKLVMGLVSEREGRHDGEQKAVLIGGWAVDAYNSWYGSIDIDIVTNRWTKKYLIYHLINDQGYVHYKEHGASTVARILPSGKKIIIDFAAIGDSHGSNFEGRKEELNFDLLEGRTVVKNIRDSVTIRVPDRSLLLLYKIKASWDRKYRLDNRRSEDPEWEKGKLFKDYGDIHALVDPNYGGRELDLNYLGETLASLKFLKAHIDQIPDDIDALNNYGRMDTDIARSIYDRLLSLI